MCEKENPYVNMCEKENPYVNRKEKSTCEQKGKIQERTEKKYVKDRG
jgi:hypothetical protein